MTELRKPRALRGENVELREDPPQCGVLDFSISENFMVDCAHEMAMLIVLGAGLLGETGVGLPVCTHHLVLIKAASIDAEKRGVTPVISFIEGEHFVMTPSEDKVH